ncbi:MAG TPA: hypothetical protein VGW39_07640 [Chthoniobacterales bacterium]|nr:hypothetical protein [Chthoniobacterales bacterium]
MKKFCILPLVAALAFFVSCQKKQTEEEKRAEALRLSVREKEALAEKAAANASPADKTVPPAASSPAPN